MKGKGRQDADKEPLEEDKSPASRYGWFPGHMRKTQRKLAEELSHCNLVIEMRDARIPMSSANPLLDKLVGDKPRLVVLNKAELADPKESQDWKEYLESCGIPCLLLDAQTGHGLNRLPELLALAAKPYQDSFARRGIRPPPPRMMVAGIPNVGKSTLINRLAGRKRQTISPNPGTTRNLSWILVKDKFYLLDSPGVMPPRIDSDEVAMRLGWVGGLPDHIAGPPALAASLLELLAAKNSPALLAHYRLAPPAPTQGEELLAWLAGKKGMVRKGGVVDINRMAETVLSDFRAGKLGRYNLEEPPPQ